MADFERFVEVISKKEDKRVVNITVRPIVTDCEGDIWFTDLMLRLAMSKTQIRKAIF